MRQELSSRSAHLAITIRCLLMSVKASGHDEIKFVFGPSHRHIKQAALFLEFRRCAGAEV